MMNDGKIRSKKGHWVAAVVLFNLVCWGYCGHRWWTDWSNEIGRDWKRHVRQDQTILRALQSSEKANRHLYVFHDGRVALHQKIRCWPYFDEKQRALFWREVVYTPKGISPWRDMDGNPVEHTDYQDRYRSLGQTDSYEVSDYPVYYYDREFAAGKGVTE